MAIKFRDNPNTTLPELQQELKRVVAQVKDPVILNNVLIGTASTSIAHGLGFKPRAVTAMAQTAGVSVTRATASDERAVYLLASSATLADVVVHP